MQKVLLVDDKLVFHWLYKRGIKNQFIFLSAYRIRQARELFDSHPDIAAIVVDAHMDAPLEISFHRSMREWGFNTRGLIRELSQRFQGPIVAAPGQWWHFRPMREAGCTHHCWKWNVGSLLKKLLSS